MVVYAVWKEEDSWSGDRWIDIIFRTKELADAYVEDKKRHDDYYRYEVKEQKVWEIPYVDR